MQMSANGKKNTFRKKDDNLTKEVIENILNTLENIKKEIDYKLEIDFNIKDPSSIK